MNEEDLKAVANLIASSNFNEEQYKKNRLDKKIKEYTNKIYEDNTKKFKYDFNESDFDSVIEHFIYDKTKEKIMAIYLEYRFNNESAKSKLKVEIVAILTNKKLFRNLWHENHDTLKKALLSIFKFKKDIPLNKLEIANLFIKDPIVKEINEKNNFFISEVLTLTKSNTETLADKKMIDLRNSIKKDMRNQEKSEGYIILEDIKMLKNQVLEGEKTLPSAWKYTENWKEIKKYCSASAIHGATRVLGNLLFLVKNNQIENIEPQINDVLKVVEKLEKEIKK